MISGAPSRTKPVAAAWRLDSLIQAHLALILFSLLLLGFFGFSLYQLGSVPRVHQDEPWIASTGWKFASDGVLGSDMFAGFYGMERHYYQFMPLYSLLQALVFSVAGVGLEQARLVSVALGVATLILAFTLGGRLISPAVGLLAVTFLLLAPLSGQTVNHLSGILFVDTARVARYDIAVPVFGLASLHAYLSARDRSSLRLYALAGLLAGLSGLSHLYGLFWLAALVVLALWEWAGSRALAALLVGCIVPWLPFLAWLLPGLSDWRGQMSFVEQRMRLLDFGWYVTNLRDEPSRYGPGLDFSHWSGILRPGLWLTVVLLPVSLIALARRAIRHRDPDARVIVVPAVVLPALFALLLQHKLASYAVTLLPLAALVVAWGVVELWHWLGGFQHRAVLRVVLLLALLGVGAEGVNRLRLIPEAAANTTPYQEFIDQVHGPIPPGTRTMGLHTYWFGLDDLEYRTWFVPLAQTNERYWQPPLTLDETLDRIAPEVILIDPQMRQHFASNPDDDATVLAWMARHGFVETSSVDDPTYGRIEIFGVRQ